MSVEQEVASLTVAVNGVTAAVEADATTRQQLRDEAVAAAAAAGDVGNAARNAAISTIRGGVDASGDTLAKVAALVALERGRLDAILGGANPAVDTFIEAYQRFLADESAAAALTAALGNLQSAFNAHAADKANPHGVTKAQIGLGSADDTSDAAKPVSLAQGMAIAARLAASSNLADLIDKAAARSNLGLGDLATLGSTPFGRSLLALAGMGAARQALGLATVAASGSILDLDVTLLPTTQPATPGTLWRNGDFLAIS